MKVFQGRNVVLLTKHKKDIAIKPILESATGCSLIVENRFDTDKLGTFTRDVERKKSQLETAREKNRVALKLSKADIVIASEGSFGSHPMAPIPWNLEIVLLYDKQTQTEIFGVYEGSDTNFDHIITNDWPSVLQFASKVGFPSHHLIMRPDKEQGKPVIKDIDGFDNLEAAFHRCQKRSKSGSVFIETDMRAYANPTRMKNIALATQNLIEKINRHCPKCNAYGFMITEVVKGLPCEMCQWPSELTLKYIYQCHLCKHTEEELYPKGMNASAQYCHWCNP